MNYSSVRQAVFRALDPRSKQTRFERGGNIAIGALIVANVVAVIAESMPGPRARFADAFGAFETFSVYAFTLEYVLRVWTSVELPGHRHWLGGRLRFVASPMAILDLLVVLPYYLPGTFFLDLRFVRIVRVVRMLRVLKLARYSRTLRTFAAVFRDKRPELALMLLFLAILVVVSSSLMYFVEHGAQPEQFSSIPAAMWWSTMTLTTVGYGDIYPITPVGKFLGALIGLVGIGFFALPAGVLASGFAEELAKHRAAGAAKTCPHCGGDVGTAP
jgi:voltage-gated potassium channel